MNQTKTIRWLLYHNPIELFQRTAEAFGNEITKLTNGRVNVEVYTMDEYADKFKNGVKYEPLALMQAGDVEMSQVQIGQIGAWNASDFFALEMPFIFRDHDHATKVLEGEIGKGLLNSLDNTTPVHGLAFTYSGGYRCIASDVEINTVEDLAGINLMTTMNPVMIETVTAFGATPNPQLAKDTDRRWDVAQTSDAIETTLPRYEYEANIEKHKYITDTKHNMYLTSIIISKDFWNSLDEETQQAMNQAALASSRLERKWSVADAEKFAADTQKHTDLGISYKELDAKEVAKLKDSVEVIYDKYKVFFSPGLVDGIIKS